MPGFAVKLLFVVALATILLVISCQKKKSKSKYAYLPLPPGPKPLPIIGNVLDLPRSREFATYHKWSKMYGDVVHAQAFGQHIVILNSVQAARELLDQRSGNYSDRPHIPMVHDPLLMHLDWSFPIMRYNARWKRHRRLFAQYLNPMTMKAYSEKITAAAHTLLRNLLSDSTTLHKGLKHAIGSILLDVVYGYEVLPEDDPFVKLAEDTVILTTHAISPGAFLVNVIPSLVHIPAWIPGNRFKPFAAKVRKIHEQLIGKPYEHLKEKIDRGEAVSSVVSKALADIAQADSLDPQKLDDIKKLAAVMYAAGADTTTAPVQFAVLNAILRPEIQQRAQTELDSVLGSPNSNDFRLPTFEDGPALPYITALVKESLRWIPVQPISLPHASLEEDEFRGWRIPKGAVILPNAWTMLHDEKTYKDPFTFRPERFLTNEAYEAEPDPGEFGVFGFGRRKCPGDHIAEKVIWMELACLFAAFNFMLPKDEKGSTIDISYATIPGKEFILHPPSYPCSITVRSKIVEERIYMTNV